MKPPHPVRAPAELFALIKSHLKRQKLNYTAVAEELEVSLPTVKRWLSGSTPLTLDHLTRMLNLLGLEFWEAMDLARPLKPRGYRFTLEQEQFFAAHPHYLAFLESFGRGETSIEDIQRRHSISRRAVNRYLQNLERLGLLRRNKRGKWSTPAKGALQWDDYGPLGKLFSTRQIQQQARRAIEGKQDNGHLWLRGWRFSDTARADFERELTEMCERYQLRSQRERSDAAPDRNYGFAAMIDAWEDDLFARIIEI